MRLLVTLAEVKAEKFQKSKRKLLVAGGWLAEKLTAACFIAAGYRRYQSGKSGVKPPASLVHSFNMR